MAIQPLSLPAAAGLDYGKGDVRHFAPGDAVDVPGISNPTRFLAQRDNSVAEKLNEVISVVNNQEQYVPVPIPRTLIAPNEELIITNFRIVPGFEARVLDAAISATPNSPNIELNVCYAEGFGNNTGTAVVTTATEFMGGVKFYQAGEFIVTVKNTGAVTLEITASVQFTQRPIGAAGTLLVGTIIEGRQGPIGPTGFPGPIGPPGSGGAGSPGMVWQGTWTNGNPYHTNDVVAFSLYGSIVSSFICRVANTASVGSNDPGTDAIITWNPVAIGGATGIGEQGPPGVILNAPVIAFTPFNGTLFTGADFVAGDDTPDGYLGTGLAASGTFADLSINEFSISSGTIAGSTIAFLYGNPKLYFKGHGTIRLPSVADGAQFNYNNAFIKVTIADNGTYFGAPVAETVISTGVASGSDVTVFGTFAGDTHAVSISALPSPLSDFVVTVIDPNPVKIQLNIFGAQNL